MTTDSQSSQAVCVAVPLLPQHEQLQEEEDLVDLELCDNNNDQPAEATQPPRPAVVLLLLIVGALAGFGVHATRSTWSIACSNVTNDLLGFALVSMVANMVSYLLFSTLLSRNNEQDMDGYNIQLSCTFGTALFFGACSMYSMEVGVPLLTGVALLPWILMMLWLVSPTKVVVRRKGTVLPTVVV